MEGGVKGGFNCTTSQLLALAEKISLAPHNLKTGILLGVDSGILLDVDSVWMSVAVRSVVPVAYTTTIVGAGRYNCSGSR